MGTTQRHVLVALAALAASLALGAGRGRAQEERPPARAPTPGEVRGLGALAAALERAEHLPDTGARTITIDLGEWQGVAVLGSGLALAAALGAFMDHVLPGHAGEVFRETPPRAKPRANGAGGAPRPGNVLSKTRAGLLLLPLLLLPELAQAAQEARDDGAG